MEAVINGSPQSVRPPRMRDGEAANNQSSFDDKKGSKDTQATLSGNRISPVAAGVWRELHNAIMDGEISHEIPDLSRYFRQRSLEGGFA